MTELVSSEELKSLRKAVDEANQRLTEDISREIGDVPKRPTDVFNRWEAFRHHPQRHPQRPRGRLAYGHLRQEAATAVGVDVA